MKSETSVYYASHPKAAEKRRVDQRKINSRPSQVKYRSQLNKANRKAGTYGNGDSIDKSHTKSGKLVNEKQSKNRARNGSGGKSTKK